MKQLSISTSILNCPAETQSWHEFRHKNGERPYRHWERAEEVLKRAKNEFDRSEVVGSLKRAIDSRLRTLNENYHFKRLGAVGKNGPLAALEGLGVVRQPLINRLLRIRNEIEHMDSAPPGVKECDDLVEFTWYFLRCTDRLTTHFVDSVEFRYAHESGGETIFHSQIKFGDTWTIEASGWINADLVRDDTHPRLHIELTRQEIFRDLKARTGDDALLEIFTESHSARKDSDLFIQGTVTGASEAQLAIIRKHFSAV